MKKAAYKTTTFKTGNENFMIDIVEHEESFISPVSDDYKEFIRDIWLYRENIGIKQYVIGELKRYWQGKTAEQTAIETIEYLKEKGTNGLNWYESYDEEYY